MTQDIELVIPAPSDSAELGRIAYEAFRQIAGTHGFPHDFPNPEVAARVVDLVAGLPRSYRVAARVQGKIVGSNFMIMTDDVAAVGPISVDPVHHGRGVGRRLMQAALNYAEQQGFKKVRLLQDSYNTTSLSLYASLGFDVREPIAVMQPGRAGARDAGVRPAQPADLDSMEHLCVRHYKVSRRGELAAWLERKLPVLVQVADGRINGYLVPGTIGHGVAETEAVAMALISQIPHYTTPGHDGFFCPLRNTSLFRAALRSGCRLVKVMTLMTRGPYEDPAHVWMPSIAY